MSPGADFYQRWPLARQNTGAGSAWDAVTKTKWAGVSLSFDLGGTVFGLADITTTAGALVFLSGIGVDRSLVFTGVGDGFDSGSLDFKSGATDLSFGPTGSEGLYYAQVAGGDILYHGDYGAQARVPAPPTPLLILRGLGAMGVRRYGTRRDATMAETEMAG